MANEEHLTRLQQGISAWNQWRDKFPEIHPDLCGVGLTSKELSGVNLAKADLTGANLARAALIEANLFRANLTRANLREANLAGTNLTKADLAEADFSAAVMGWTILGDVDLSPVLGLKTVRHMGLSTIGVDTLYRSRALIPEAFLPGVGIPDEMITYIKSLVGRPFEFYSCFISYSSKDQEFAERLHAKHGHDLLALRHF